MSPESQALISEFKAAHPNGSVCGGDSVRLKYDLVERFYRSSPVYAVDFLIMPLRESRLLSPVFAQVVGKAIEDTQDEAIRSAFDNWKERDSQGLNHY